MLQSRKYEYFFIAHVMALSSRLDCQPRTNCCYSVERFSPLASLFVATLQRIYTYIYCTRLPVICYCCCVCLLFLAGCFCNCFICRELCQRVSGQGDVENI